MGVHYGEESHTNSLWESNWFNQNQFLMPWLLLVMWQEYYLMWQGSKPMNGQLMDKGIGVSANPNNVTMLEKQTDTQDKIAIAEQELIDDLESWREGTAL